MKAFSNISVTRTRTAKNSIFVDDFFGKLEKPFNKEQIDEYKSVIENNQEVFNNINLSLGNISSIFNDNTILARKFMMVSLFLKTKTNQPIWKQTSAKTMKQIEDFDNITVVDSEEEPSKPIDITGGEQITGTEQSETTKEKTIENEQLVEQQPTNEPTDMEQSETTRENEQLVEQQPTNEPTDVEQSETVSKPKKPSKK